MLPNAETFDTMLILTKDLLAEGGFLLSRKGFAEWKQVDIISKHLKVDQNLCEELKRAELNQLFSEVIAASL